MMKEMELVLIISGMLLLQVPHLPRIVDNQGMFDAKFYGGNIDAFVTKLNANPPLFITSPFGGEVLQANAQYIIAGKLIICE